MIFNFNRHTAAKVASAIAATAFLSAATVLPQAAFSQSSPGSSGDPRTDEPGTGTRVDDPSRPATGGTSERNRNNITPTDGSPAGGGVNSTPRGQMNDSGVGGGAGGTGTDQSRPAQPQNRVEQYGQPGVNDPARSRQTAPTSPGGTMTPGTNRSTMPSSTTPNRSTVPTPQGQDSTGTGGGAGGNTNIDRQINNSTSPGSATPGAGSTNINNGGGTTGGSGAVPGLW